MPSGYPRRGRKYRFLEARHYLDISSRTFKMLIETGTVKPDGKMPTGERFWYADTLDRSPITGLNYRESSKTTSSSP